MRCFLDRFDLTLVIGPAATRTVEVLEEPASTGVQARGPRPGGRWPPSDQAVDPSPGLVAQ